MTVVKVTGAGGFYGLSSDTKPTTLIPTGSQFFETDTNNIYVFNGATWASFTNPPFISTPAQGSVQRVSAGFLAPGQTAKSYVGTAITPATCAAPIAPTGADGGAGVLSAGTYTWKITFVSAAGESQGGVTSANQVLAVSHQGALTAIPLGPAGTTQRKVYRTKANGHDGSQLLSGTIADNVTTTYTDNVADGSLGVAYPIRNNWVAPLTVALGTVTALKTWLLTDAFISTDAPASVEAQIQAAGSTIFRGLFQGTSPIEAAGIETQPNAAAGNALTLLVQGTSVPQTVEYTLEAIEQ